VIDWYRKRSSRSAFLVEDDTADAPLNLEEILFDPAENPDEVYHRSFLWKELADAMERLPEPQREVFVMHELEGRSFREIGEITGVPINTLLSRKRYAILALRESLQEIYDEYRT
jgi:RNA polymerase sigma factor (sigma-70 family)